MTLRSQSICVIAVTCPKGRTRYVGDAIPWVDSPVRALPFADEAEAQIHIHNANTAANSRMRAGWSVRAEAA